MWFLEVTAHGKVEVPSPLMTTVMIPAGGRVLAMPSPLWSGQPAIQALTNPKAAPV